MRGGDRQETGSGDQRAGEHREGGTGPGITRRLDPVEALLHLDRHHFHGDDGVVHQQAQRQHQCAEGNLVQADPQVIHAGERHRQHQRNGQGHHHAGAHAEGEEAHQQHDGQRLDQHLDELADPGFHRRRLVGDLAQLHAGREILLDTGKLDFQGLAQHQDVTTVLHRHRQADGVFSHEAHARSRWIVEPATHVRDIRDAERPIADANREVLDLLYRLKIPRDP
ncbi:hypothetical protein D3C73_1072290 [compost metagenome]